MAGAKFPFFLQWHLTERCNLHCMQRYQHTPTGEMGYYEINLAMDKLEGVMQCWAANYELEVVPSIHFTGGEPFLRDDLFMLLRRARQRGFTTSLLSNGTPITSGIAGKLREVGVEDVQFSLDGMEFIHDSIRGQGAFRKNVTGTRHLVAEGIDANVNVTVSSLNYRGLDQVLRFAGELDVSSVGFSRLGHCGRSKELSMTLLTTEQLSELSRSGPAVRPLQTGG